MKLLIAALSVCLITAIANADNVKLPEKLDATGFHNVLADAGKAFVSGQPTQEGLKRLAAEGVTTVINFRRTSEMEDSVDFDEAATAKALGLTYIHIPVGDNEHPYSSEALAAFGKAMKAAEGKALVHCASAYRASHMWTAYLVQFEGMELNEAISHGRAVNLRTQPFETLLGGVTYSRKENTGQ